MANPIRKYLDEEIEKQRGALLLLATTYVVGAVFLLLFLMLLVEIGSYMVLQLVTDPTFVPGHILAILMAVAMIGVHLFTRGQDATDLSSVGTGSENVDPTVQAGFLSVVVLWFTVAPRLVEQGVESFREYRGMSGGHRDELEQVIRILLAAKGRVPYTRITEQLPDLNAEQIFHMLRNMEGVTPLTSDPPGLSLNDELRARLADA